MSDSLVEIALEKLSEAVGQKLALFAGATRELERLNETFHTIQALLRDAESRQVAEESVRVWLSRLKHASYDIDDVLDEWKTSGANGEDWDDDDDAAGHNSRSENKICHCFLPNFDGLISRYKLARRVKEIRERLDRIAVERNGFSFSSSPLGGDHSIRVRSQRLTTSLIDESEMVVGRENDKAVVINKLVGGSSSNEDGSRQVQVVSVVGIGGLGKTTLARVIYHDRSVRDHFKDALYWVCVSETFDVTKLTKQIIEEVKRETPTLSGLNALQNELLRLLRGKRYLLVLDDVWNDDADRWAMLRVSLKSGALGSRILVTTRSDKVAYTMNATYIHELQGLTDDQSWTLFSSRAFAGRRANDISEFEVIGKEIVSKCRGVPLSIKVISSAMYSKRTVEEWQNVLESKTWHLPQVTDKILPALLLTYSNLPTHLKQCFAYCSVFPKDWVLHKDVLIRLWSAQGFIRLEGNRDTEDIGEEYFDELVAWSMLQEVRRDY